MFITCPTLTPSSRANHLLQLLFLQHWRHPQEEVTYFNFIFVSTLTASSRGCHRLQFSYLFQPWRHPHDAVIYFTFHICSSLTPSSRGSHHLFNRDAIRTRKSSTSIFIICSTLTPSSRGNNLLTVSYLFQDWRHPHEEILYFNLDHLFNIDAILARKSSTSMFNIFSTLAPSSRGGHKHQS